jgi:hypothetical protein
MTRSAAHPDAAAAIAAVTTGPDGLINFLADPAATEVIARLVAEQLSALDVDCLVIRDGTQSAVLAHVVARNLGCSTLRVCEIEGLVEFMDEPMAEARTAVIGARFPTENSLGALVGRARHSGLYVAAIVAVTSSPALRIVAASDDAGILHVIDGGPA